MHRYLYRCPVCRTTSPVRHSPAALTAEGDHHRQALHDGHHPDGERSGEVDDLDLVARLHARLTDTYANIHDPKGSGALGQQYLILALRTDADGDYGFDALLPCPVDPECAGPAWAPVHSVTDLYKALTGSLDSEYGLRPLIPPPK